MRRRVRGLNSVFMKEHRLSRLKLGTIVICSCIFTWWFRKAQMV